MAFKISEGGMSAATPNILWVGEQVELYPLLGHRLTTFIKRKKEAMYGFEFVRLTEEQRAKLRAKCQNLPLFNSLIDV